VVVFQPHRYSRTQALFDDFTRAFYQSDILTVLPVYPAGEAEIEGVNSRELVKGIKQHGHKDVVFAQDPAAAVGHLRTVLGSDDILLTLGAGDVWKVGEMLLEEMGV